MVLSHNAWLVLRKKDYYRSQPLYDEGTTGNWNLISSGFKILQKAWITLDTTSAPQRSGFPQQKVLNVIFVIFFGSTVFCQLVEVFGSKYCPSSSHKENNEVLHEKVIITSMWLIKCKWMSQVAKRLKQEQDDKDLMIVFEDLPLVKVIFNSKGCCWNHL